MDLNALPWIDRLKSEASQLNGRVEGAVEFAAVKKESTQQTPRSWVVPARETASPSDLENATSQNTREEFLVITAVRNVRDGTGKAAHDELREIRREQKDALIGWELDEDHEPVEFIDGRPVLFSNGVIWWIDRYRTAYEERRN